MGSHETHAGHEHEHAKGWGHTVVQHGDHQDFLHDGCLHHVHGDHVDEHRLEVGKSNPDDCTPDHACDAHDAAHSHGPSCGHEEVPHGDHSDYLVDGHLHHAHGDHCDDHGKLKQLG